MGRRIETKIETIEHKVNIISCDICHKEISYLEVPVYGSDFKSISDDSGVRRWWKKQFDRIVGIKKDIISDEINNNPDFEVHVGCVYELIKKEIGK